MRILKQLASNKKNLLYLLSVLSIYSCQYLAPTETKNQKNEQNDLHENPDSSKYRLKAYGKVVDITDGDTFTLLTDNNKKIKIRLHEIDAPETKNNQRFSKQARKALSELVFGKTVYVYHKIGIRGNSWNRTVGVVFEDDINVNREMIRLGFAWHSKNHCFGYTMDSLEFDSIERAARFNKRGLWQDNSPIPPWIKRKE